MMFVVEQSQEFKDWFARLTDPNAKARVDTRLRRLRRGLFGDVKPVGQGVSELRIDYGPGYRVYFMQSGERIILLLLGGDKRRQASDIRLAQELAEAERRKRKAQ